jgi:Squalene-hopene cyclase C-terminal domain
MAMATVGHGICRAVNDLAAPSRDPQARVETIRNSVSRALPLLVKASAQEYPKQRECFSCHNQAISAVALRICEKRGFEIGANTLHKIAEHTESDLNAALDDYRTGKGQPGGVIRAGYALWTLEVADWPPDETTRAVAHYLQVIQTDRKRWPPRANRPPSESSSFTATALALRGLDAFRTPASGDAHEDVPRVAKSGSRNESIAELRARALRWLEQTTPRETEDRVFRLWGLKYAGASSELIAKAARDLTQTQRRDGGWSQLDPPGQPTETKDPATKASAGFASDAYATGSALVALHLTGGVATDGPTYQRGLAFLIRTQLDDGSWRVKSRSQPFQAYFESGFPHGPDQFISAAASAWATAALALACPKT